MNMMIESSPSSAGSASFREHDDVFLQTQTRIWIGEVLQTRLDDDLQLSDLLQDGEILLEVSKVMWNLLLSKCMELKHLKHKYGPFGSRKNSGRYRPYSNVDSFLKLCKILGLSGIDLFSPSDVVEKRDIRKVCICIRALSKKTRSKQLSVVPDFDVVIRSVTMPKEIVDGIKKNLESSSQCTTLSSTSSFKSQKGSNMKLKQNKIYTTHNRDEDFLSEASDEAESRYMGDGSFSPDRENSPEESAQHIMTEKCYCTEESEEKPCDNDSSRVGDSSSCIAHETGEEENNYIRDYLAFSDLMVHASDENGDDNGNMFDFFLKVDSDRARASDRSSKYGNFSNEEDIDEVSSTTSMSSVLGRLLTMEFEEHCNDPSVSQDDEEHVEHKTGPAASSSVCSKNESCDIEITSQGDKDDDKESLYCQDNNDYEVVGEIESSSYLDRNESENEPSLQENRIPSFVQERGDDFPVTAPNPEEEVKELSDVVDGKKKETGSNKGHRVVRKEQVIKTVVKGTAIAGFLFLLMHIRKTNGSKPSAMLHRAENRPGKGIYPAERLRF